MFSVQTSALPTRHAHLDNMRLIAGESGRWVAMRSVKPLDRR
jgi:DNA-binding cell septation regulator SpoVG